MFNYNVALNHAILEGAVSVFSQYGGFEISDSLDIMWYKDTDWVETFETMLGKIKSGDSVSIFCGNDEYILSITKNYFFIHFADGNPVAKIPTYSENDLFLYMTTLLKGEYEL